MADVLLVSMRTLYRYSFEFNLELICTSEFFKKLKLHEPQFHFLKNSQVQINSKLNEKNHMITY